MWDSSEVAGLISNRLAEDQTALAAAFSDAPADAARLFHIDDLLPPDLIKACAEAAPPLEDMIRLNSHKERKYVSAQLSGFSPVLQHLVEAFNSDEVAAAVSPIVGGGALHPDTELYNGGITTMTRGDFMRPHLDNSHDYSARWPRRAVLLFYLSPNWQAGDGGNLRVWDDFGRGVARQVPFMPNRLVCLETCARSWHSVDVVDGPRLRINLTTYLYDRSSDRRPVRLTRFRSWPGERALGLCMEAEFYARSLAAQLGLRRLRRNRHINRPQPG